MAIDEVLWRGRQAVRMPPEIPLIGPVVRAVPGGRRSVKRHSTPDTGEWTFRQAGLCRVHSRLARPQERVDTRKIRHQDAGIGSRTRMYARGRTIAYPVCCVSPNPSAETGRLLGTLPGTALPAG